jgi:tetratricopeptide (TPR) repeat protein
MVDKAKKKMSSPVRKFLASGAVGNQDAGVLAQELSQLIRLKAQHSPKTAGRLARSFVEKARPHGGILLSTALRALGWTLHMSGRYAQARGAYLEARRILRRDPFWRARVDLILIDIFMYLGDVVQARSRYRSALQTFDRLGEKTEAARTRVNYANLLHRQDRHAEAGRLYRRALKTLESTDDHRSLAICQYNLANTLVQTFDFDGATDLYLKAEKSFQHLNYDLYANECRYGLAWLCMLRGDYHHALSGLADCETGYERAGQQKGVVLCQLDRAETYLALNLLTDARNAAQAAEKAATRLGLKYEASKAGLLKAQALLTVGDLPAGRRALRRVEAGFKASGNQAFLGVAGLLLALSNGNRIRKGKALARARRKFAKAQLPLWEAVCDLEVLSVFPEANEARRRLSRNRAVRAVPHLYALWHTMLGDRLNGLGRRAAARRHWIQAVEMLEAVRVKLPPTEVRSLLSGQRNDPYQRLVSMLSDAEPAEAAVWSERHRTAGLWAPLSADQDFGTAGQKAHKSLADLAQKISSLSTRIKTRDTREGLGIEVSGPQLMRLQRQVRRRLLEIEPGVKQPTESHARLRNSFTEVSHTRPVIQMHFEGEDILAFVHWRGLTRCHRYSQGRQMLRNYTGCWQFLLGRSIRSGRVSSRSDLKDERHLFTDLGRWLLAPLEEISGANEILVLPQGELWNLPWQALIADGHALVEATGVIVAPSLRHFQHAAAIEAGAGTAEVFVGRTEGLTACHEELAVFRNRPDWDVAYHDQCTRSDWQRASQSHIWHYLGHAEFRSDNPIYSSLQLIDGPIFAADFQLRQNLVGLVTLAACRTGQQTYMPGEESSGLVRSLLEMGARNVIASHWAVADKSTALWMRTFYESYLENVALHKSMKQAALAVRERFPSAYHWAAFSLFGAG